jgi:hypothetical protein
MGTPGPDNVSNSVVESARRGVMTRRQLLRLAVAGTAGAIATNMLPGQEPAPQPLTSLVLRDVSPSPLRMDLADEVRAAFLKNNPIALPPHRTPRDMDPAALDYCFAVNEAIAQAMGMGGHTLKSQMGRMAKEWAIINMPLPPLVDALIIPFLRAAVAEKLPDRNKLAKEGTKYASGIIQRYLSPDDFVGFEARFQKAPPWERAQIFVDAVKRLVNDRVWPTAFSQYLTINPYKENTIELMERFSPGSSKGWSSMDQAQRTEAVRKALGEFLDLAERVSSDGATQGDYEDLSKRSNLGENGWTGTNLVQAVFGDEGVKASKDSGEAKTKVIRAAVAFNVGYMVCLATTL